MDLFPLFLALIGIVALLLLRVPVGFSFAIGALVLCTIYGISITGALTSGLSLITKFALLALPLFAFLGAVMSCSGLARRLIDFIYSIVGRIRGGLGVALVCTNTVFGAISGSASAAVIALGPIFIPQMERKGYPRGHSTAFLIASSVLSLLIPPSGNSIFFGVIAGVSVVLLFAATLVPGLILTILLSIIQVIMARKLPDIEVPPKISFIEQGKEIAQTGKRSFFILLLPLFIIGGIYSGIFTPTEAAAVSVVYAIVISWFIYRVINHVKLWQAGLEAGKAIGAIIVIFFFTYLLVRVLILLQMPNYLLNSMLAISESKVIILVMFNIILLITGMFVDDISALMFAAFVYMPAAKMAGIDPIHFGSIVILNTGMGLITPPVAPLLYLGGMIGDVPLSQYWRPVIYCLLFGYLPTILIVTYVPEVSLALPNFIIAMRG